MIQSIRSKQKYFSSCHRVNIIGQGYCVVISSSWKILALSCTIPWTGIPFTGKYHLSPPVKYYYLGGAPKKADPANIQALTHCFAIDHLEGEDHTIDRPEMYDFWKNHTPALDPPWPGPILSLDYSNPRTLVPKTLSFVPPGRTTPAPETETLNLWLYRRMIDRSNFEPGTYASDITLVNWPQNDYMLGNITDVTPEERKTKPIPGQTIKSFVALLALLIFQMAVIDCIRWSGQ